MKYLTILFLFPVIIVAQQPQFSDQLLEIPLYNGLSGVFEKPVIVDVEEDGDVDLVFSDFCLGTILFRNVGSDSSFFFQRDDALFDFLPPIDNYNNQLRFQDFDNDGLTDITIVYDTYVLGFRALAVGQWQVNADTVFHDESIASIGNELKDFVYVDLIDDSQPEIVIATKLAISDGPIQLYKSVADTLQRIPEYFSGVEDPGNWVLWSRTDFFTFPGDSSPGLLVNSAIQSLPFVFSHATYYRKNETGNGLNWSPQPMDISNQFGSGLLFPLTTSNPASRTVPAYLENRGTDGGILTYGRFVPQMTFTDSGSYGSAQHVWMKGPTTQFDDLAELDYDNDGIKELLFLSNSALGSGGFGFTAVYFYQLLSPIELSPSPLNTPFLENFPPIRRTGHDWGPSGVALGDLDNDGDQDIVEVNYRFEKILWNLGNDEVPAWNDSSLVLDIPDDWHTPSLVDLDGDADLDLVMAKNSVLYLFDNLGSAQQPQFADSGIQLVTTISKVHSVFADFDEDEDLDLIAGNRFYRNQASAGQPPEFVEVADLLPAYDSTAAIELVDPDNDGDWDIAVLLKDGSLHFVRNTTPLAITTGRTEPADFLLLKNFPNPFNNGTVVQFSLPQRQHVRIAVYDVLGREVVELTNANMAAGLHEFEWNGAGAGGRMLASGNYYLRLQAADQTITRQIQIVR